MRLTVLLLATCLCSSAWAVPALTVQPDRPVYLLDVRLVAPDGTISWTCQKETEADSKPIQASCEAPPEWFRGPGKYVLISLADRLAETADTKEFETTGEEQSITWTVPYGRLMTLARSDPRIRLTFSTDSIQSASLTNGSEKPVWGSFIERGAEVRFERFENGAWNRLGNHSPTMGRDELAPGETKRVYVPPRLISDLDPGRYRAVLNLQLTPPEGARAEQPSMFQQVEVTSDPFDFRPGMLVDACLREETPVVPIRGDDPFRSLHTTSAGVLLLKSSGELLRVDDGSMQPLATLPADSRLREGPTEDLLLVTGPQLMISKNGGRTFQPLGHVSSTADEQFVFAGEKLFRLSIRGDVAWIDMNGKVTPVHTPVVANWRAAAFRDEKHGALMGDCSVLLETDDGGVTWKASPTPWPLQYWMRWDNEDLVVSGARGTWVRKAGSAAFEQMDSRPEISRPFRYTFRWKDDRKSGKETIDLEVFRRDAQGKELSRSIHLDDPPFRFALGVGLASDGSVYLLTSPAGLFRYQDGLLKVLLSNDSLKRYSDERQQRRERMRKSLEHMPEQAPAPK